MNLLVIKVTFDTQLGTAVACGADFILTNDRTWQKFEEVKVRERNPQSLAQTGFVKAVLTHSFS